jgi:hypothetical protein
MLYNTYISDILNLIKNVTINLCPQPLSFFSIFNAYILSGLIICILITIFSAKRAAQQAARSAGRKTKGRTSTNSKGESTNHNDTSGDKAKGPASPSSKPHPHTSHTDINIGQIAGAGAIAYLGGKAIDKGYSIELDGLNLSPSKPVPIAEELTSQEPKPDTKNTPWCNIL